jgi:tetratricopeptide (TPR) repeat protein
MGIVLKALDTRLDRVVAIKLLAPGLAATTLARRRFEREARAAAAVCHEHVVTIHAVDEADGHPYLVMQFVAGQSLQEKLDRSGALGVPEILQIGMQVASGLAAAHAQGLIHRDIKPANLLLERGTERVKITDFGLARAIDDASITDSVVILGTPHFMSPEQARGEPVDHRTDLFSLGGVLFAMCTGQPPFRAESTVAVLRKVSDDAPRSIRALNPAIPAWLEEIISKLLAKDPADRYQSAAEVAELFSRQLAQLKSPSIATAPAERLALAAPTERTKGVRPRLVAICGIIAVIGIAGWLVQRSLGPILAPGKTAPGPLRRSAARESAALAPARPSTPPFPPAPGAAAPLPPPAVTAEAAKEALKLIAAGADAYRHGEIQQALERYTQAVHVNPSNTRALLARAYVQIDSRVMNWPDAIADATEVIRLDPKNVEAFEVRAAAAHRAGDYRRAIEDATEAIRLDPARATGYAHRGASYRAIGEWKHALVDLNETLTRTPNASWSLFDRAMTHFSLGDIDRSLADVNRAVQADPGVNQFQLFRAQVFARKKDYGRAKADLAEAIRISSEPEKYLAYQRRAEFEMGLSQLDAAMADFTETIRSNHKMAETKDVSAFGGRAHVYLAHGQTESALADCEAALRIDPKAKWILPYRGLAFARKGQWDRAIADFDEEVRRQPSTEPTWHTFKAGALALAGRYDQAAAAYDELLAKFEGIARGTLSARAYYLDRSRGHYEDAIRTLNLAENPVWPPNVFLYRGIIHARMGDPDRALDDFKKLMAIVADSRGDFFAMHDFVPRWLVFWLGRGEAYMHKGDLDHALADADEAVRFLPTSAEARLLRASIHDKRGNSDLAAADRRAALQLLPDPIVAGPKRESPGAANPR